VVRTCAGLRSQPRISAHTPRCAHVGVRRIAYSQGRTSGDGHRSAAPAFFEGFRQVVEWHSVRPVAPL